MHAQSHPGQEPLHAENTMRANEDMVLWSLPQNMSSNPEGSWQTQHTLGAPRSCRLDCKSLHALLACISGWQLQAPRQHQQASALRCTDCFHLLLKATRAGDCSNGPAWEWSTEGPAADALQGPHQLCMGQLGVRMLTSEA